MVSFRETCDNCPWSSNFRKDPTNGFVFACFSANTESGNRLLCPLLDVLQLAKHKVSSAHHSLIKK